MQISGRHLLAGLAGTWLVGMGRYWDDPDASMAQHLGIGSVLYVFVFGTFLFLLILPLLPLRWRYGEFLAFVSLTSFPALLYAIPVEKFLSPVNAGTVNLLFLVIVATWRVALLAFFVLRHARLTLAPAIVGIAFPLMSIVTVLLFLRSLSRAAAMMGGLRPDQPPPPPDFLAGVEDYALWITVTLGAIYVILALSAGFSREKKSE